MSYHSIARRVVINVKFAFLLGGLLLCSRLPCVDVSSASADEGDGAQGPLAPHVFISVLARNSAYLLPNFFGYLENLDYPKDRISVWIRTDHNVDNTEALIEEWCSAAKHVYMSVDCHSSSEWVYPTRDPYEMPEERYLNVARLRQKGLEAARKAEADYLFSIDVDSFLVNPQTLQLLFEQNKTIIAPMLTSPENSAFSNFWMDQDSGGYYKRHDDYMPILQRNRTGSFRAPVVLAAVLVHLASPTTRGLVYHPAPAGFYGPVDDIVQFPFSAKTEGVDMYICNTEVFGYIPNQVAHSSIEEAAQTFIDFKVDTLVNHPPVLTSQFISPPDTPKDNLGLDAVYMIGLVRRPDRRNRMIACLEELNFDYTLFDAVDGRQLNASYVEELGIHYMSNWRDPWGNRTMTLGEVGCFLSHYTIWNEVLSEGMQRVLVLEDDIDFEPQFKESLVTVMREAEEFTPTWDLIYVGRKLLHLYSEPQVEGTERLIRPTYSYWTLGYLLSQRGARKLLDADPFHSFLPVDEYFPILFGKHPRKDWAKHYLVQNLEVYSANPLLVFPTYYVGDEGWYSDTEPPPEILAQIRVRKEQEQREFSQQISREQEHKEKVKSKSVQRQIEQMKRKMKPKSEL